MNELKTYYDYLEIKPNASKRDITHAYRRLSLKYHPDRNSGNIDFTEKYKKINEAYDVLKDDYKKQEYDHKLNPINLLNQLQSDMNINNKSSCGGIFDSLFGSSLPFNMNMNHLGDLASGLDELIIPNENLFLEHNINITIHDSYKGIKQYSCLIKRKIIHGKRKTIEDEKIYIDIPEGIDDKEIIVIKNKGNIVNNRQGDLKIKINIISDEVFKRDGLDLIFTSTISFNESLTGFEYIIPHLNGKTLRLQSSRGNIIQNYDEKIIENKGFIRNEKIGALKIIFMVTPPKKLTDEQLNVIESIFNYN